MDVQREWMVGDPRWAPPEYPDHGLPSDIWSLGATMQATCAMRSLSSFTGESQAVAGVCEAYSEDLHDQILSIMCFEPYDRQSVMQTAKNAGWWLRKLGGEYV